MAINHLPRQLAATSHKLVPVRVSAVDLAAHMVPVLSHNNNQDHQPLLVEVSQVAQVVQLVTQAAQLAIQVLVLSHHKDSHRPSDMVDKEVSQVSSKELVTKDNNKPHKATTANHNLAPHSVDNSQPVSLKAPSLIKTLT